MSRRNGRLLVTFIMTIFAALTTLGLSKLFQFLTGIDYQFTMILLLLVYIEFLVYFYVADNFLE